MDGPDDREQHAFDGALRCLTSESRSEYLDQVCGKDAELRSRVEALLQAHEGDASILDVPVAGELTGLAGVFPSLEKPGDWLGRYRLLQLLGEGGCGAVYLAEQEEPVRRLVAVKIVKAGMDTRQVLARFAAERQALALLDHPGIAKVLDGGASSSGRPYFVMEAVRGLSVTEHCDEHALSVRSRIELFIKICRAVEHAHQRGIIHRDLKPSNIMITFHDGEPVPKVIDFGIAKALQGRLTDQTVFTALDHFVGTPAYMSPEQAELSGLDVDTRTDIFSMGVLLYELLTGNVPFPSRSLRNASIDDVRRRIREEDPKSPSTRVSTLEHSHRTLLAQRRGTDPVRWIHFLRGDLDWIIMKCLEKDRNRRYASIGDLSADLQRYLDELPVMARPPEVGYRLGKSIRRHRTAYAAGFLVVLSLLSGLAMAVAQATRARAAEKEAQLALRRAEQESLRGKELFDLLQGWFETTMPIPRDFRTFESSPTNVLAVGQIAASNAPPGSLTKVFWLSYLALYANRTGQFGRELPLLEQALKEAEAGLGASAADTERIRELLAQFYLGSGREKEAQSLFQQTVSNTNPLVNPVVLADSHLGLAEIAARRGDLGQIQIYGEKAISTVRAHLPANHGALARIIRTVAWREADNGFLAQSRARLEARLAEEETYGEIMSGLPQSQTRRELSRVLLKQGKPAEAEQLLSVAIQRHPDYGRTYLATLMGYRRGIRILRGDSEGALEDGRRLLEWFPSDPWQNFAQSVLLFRIRQGREAFRLKDRLVEGAAMLPLLMREKVARLVGLFGGSEASLSTAAELAKGVLGSPSEEAKATLGLVYWRQGRLEESREVASKLVQDDPPHTMATAQAHFVLALVHSFKGEHSEAKQRFSLGVSERSQINWHSDASGSGAVHSLTLQILEEETASMLQINSGHSWNK